MIKISFASHSFAFSTASEILCTIKTFLGCQSVLLVTTIFILPGKSFFKDSKVFLPMITGMLHVLFLKYLKSLGRRQGRFPSLPIILFSEAATMWESIV